MKLEQLLFFCLIVFTCGAQEHLTCLRTSDFVSPSSQQHPVVNPQRVYRGKQGPKGEKGSPASFSIFELNSIRDELNQKLNSLRQQLQAQSNIKSLDGNASSCQELRRNGVTINGIYRIQPNQALPGLYTYCDMTSDGGGWTLVASVHENNINGKCTVGDKWSSEQSSNESFSSPEQDNISARESWENYEVFGHIQSVTSSDYKNSAYFDLKASDVMIWHVPNDVSTANLDQEGTLKYFTSGNALSAFNFSLREFYANQFLVQRNHISGEIGTYIMNINGSIEQRIANIRNAVPNFHSYLYDGANGTHGTYITDGGSDMYDTGNVISILDNDKWINVVYGRHYIDNFYDYSFGTGAFHPFVFLAWIGNTTENLSKFGIRVTSNAGADGRGNISTSTNQFRSSDYTIWYRAFQVYNATDPSICEVYFNIANTQKWRSDVGNIVVLKHSSGTESLLNQVDFFNFRRVITGYTLLSRTSARQVSTSSIEGVLRQIVAAIDLVPFRSITDDRIAFPVSFAEGNVDILRARIPKSQTRKVTPGFLQLGAYSRAGYPYPLCPGIRLESGASPSLNCVGGILTPIRNDCGDFAGWGGDEGNLTENEPTASGRSLTDIHSSILIFTRGEN